MKFTTAIAAAILGTAVYGAALPDPNCRFPGMPCSRSAVAEADPAWHSGFRRLPGQPIGKREAEPEAEPEADPNCRFPGMPCSRSAEPEAEAEADPAWHSGFRRLPGQPIGKREAEAEAEPEAEADPAWHSGFRRLPGQPIGKREAEAEPEADPNCRFPGMPCS
ncbi:hypothetical protein SLS60_011826 [Paraconiothyrium brasiliense]|uniref:Uncharacterized protein n=1 Tax=Paraconiothyrium brasiliense TaxID=300254 RepID=A0ABR3QHD8_9PLEO